MKKRLISAVLAIALCISLSVTAFADAKAGDTEICIESFGSHTRGEQLYYTLSEPLVDVVTLGVLTDMGWFYKPILMRDSSIPIYVVKEGTQINRDTSKGYFSGGASNYFSDWQFKLLPQEDGSVGEDIFWELKKTERDEAFTFTTASYNSGKSCFATISRLRPFDPDLPGLDGQGEQLQTVYFLVLNDESEAKYKSDRASRPFKFTDVPDGAWFNDPVRWAVLYEVTTGTTRETFEPDKVCTRAEIITFIYRARIQEYVDHDVPFTDVSPDAYYYEAVKWADYYGLFKDIADGDTLSPDAPCTRAEAVTYIYRAKSSSTESDGSAQPVAFTDVPADSYYADAVDWAVMNGVTNGMGDGRFSPGQTCTRAQIVTFLYRTPENW